MLKLAVIMCIGVSMVLLIIVRLWDFYDDQVMTGFMIRVGILCVSDTTMI